MNNVQRVRDCGAHNHKLDFFIKPFPQGSVIYKEEKEEGLYQSKVVNDSKVTVSSRYNGVMHI